MKSFNWLKASRIGLLYIILGTAITGCGNGKPKEKDIVKKPEQLEDRIHNNLLEIIEYAVTHQGKVNDSAIFSQLTLLKSVYDNNGTKPFWTEKGDWLATGDSLYGFIKNSKEYGLFPSDYHYNSLTAIRERLTADSLARKDAALLSRADVLLTDALFHISYHLKRGRLPYDSLTSRKDTLIPSDLYVKTFHEVLQSKQVAAILQKLEPSNPGYRELRAVIRPYLDTIEFKPYTYLQYPFKDSITFYDLLGKRLQEEKHLFDSLPAVMDTADFRKAILKYQAGKKLKPTGKINENTVKNLNDTEWERYKRLAISLDKFKLMPDTMPVTYVWVNIPSYYLRVKDSGNTVLVSRVIVGAFKTRTPELQSDISNFITFPQWTVPQSIIFKEMLPQIQKNISYLKKQNLMVVDKNDSVIDPERIDWSKLNKNKFPYQIRQREGDDNSLGVLKFNFRNKYSVYLHDTNARWLFSKTSRAMSHGCVRVQNWKDLAFFLVRKDTVKYRQDTIMNWIARKEKHVISGFKKVPVYIRYFTCEGVDGKLRFYEDVYAEDKVLAEKYFAKNIN